MWSLFYYFLLSQKKSSKMDEQILEGGGETELFEDDPVVTEVLVAEGGFPRDALSPEVLRRLQSLLRGAVDHSISGIVIPPSNGGGAAPSVVGTIPDRAPPSSRGGGRRGRPSTSGGGQRRRQRGLEVPSDTRTAVDFFVWWWSNFREPGRMLAAQEFLLTRDTFVYMILNEGVSASIMQLCDSRISTDIREFCQLITWCLAVVTARLHADGALDRNLDDTVYRGPPTDS